VLLSELGEQEEVYAQRLEESRAVLKVIRNTERSVQPSREGKAKIAGEIARVKGREPQSARLVTLEQELVRAEAEGLVAEAQLGNVVRSSLPIPPLLLCGGGCDMLADGNRRDKNSKRPTRPSSSRPSSAPRSRPSWRGTDCGCCSCWTTRQSSPGTCARRMPMPRRQGRS
jgi:hypothetical protein